MASSKEYLHFILEQLSDLEDISYRSMMGEYILYYHGKIVGGIYDDRLLVKKTRSALECMTAAVCDFPYKGAKEMLLVDEVDNKEFLTKLVEAMYDELPLPKAKEGGLIISAHIHRTPKPNFTVQKHKESFLKHTTFALELVG